MLFISIERKSTIIIGGFLCSITEGKTITCSESIRVQIEQNNDHHQILDMLDDLMLSEGEGVKHFCRQLMALPLLPEPVIEDTYDELLNALSSTMKETLNNLLQFFQEYFLEERFTHTVRYDYNSNIQLFDCLICLWHHSF